MIDQFHVHVQVEPCRRLGEEAVGVGCDVPLAQRSDKLRLEAGRVERSQIDAYMCFVSYIDVYLPICGETDARVYVG